MAEILRRCGDDLTRANVLKQAASLSGFHSPYMLDGVTYSYTTSSTTGGTTTNHGIWQPAVEQTVFSSMRCPSETSVASFAL